MQVSHYVSASTLANRATCMLEQSGGEARVHTSILALLRGLGLLGEAGVQPRGRLRVVTAEHKKRESVKPQPKTKKKEKKKKTQGSRDACKQPNQWLTFSCHPHTLVARWPLRRLEVEIKADAKCETRQSCLYSYVLNTRGCAIGRKITMARRHL